MTTRSIVLSTAAFVLFAAAAPAPFGFGPAPALAQNVNADVAAALAGDPAGLSPDQLRRHIDALRHAIDAGAVDERQARVKLRAYAEELRAQRAGRQQQQAEPDNRAAERQRRQQEKRAEQERRQQEKRAEQERRQQEKEAEQARRQQEKQAERERQRAQQEKQAEQARRQQEKQAERERQRAQQEKQAEQARRQQEKQAEQARRQREKQAEQARQRQQEQQAQQRERQTAVQVAGDSRPSSALELQELRQRIQRLRDAIDRGVLTGDEVLPARRQMRADAEELRNRLAERQRAQQQSEEPRQGRQRAEDAPRGEVANRAQALLADNTPAARLRDEALRRRLQETRALLATGQLSRDYERALRQRLRDDRDEIRSRRSEQASIDDRPPRTSRSETTINIDVILDQRRPSDRLSEEELEWRVRTLQQALREERIARRDAEIARHIVEQDRRELRQRLRHQRERRREALYRARDRDELNIDFHVEFRPPPVIYAAEAAMEEIEVQLVAPPLYQPPRAYSFQEIVTNHEVRQAMPGIEIDTLNFDFGSAEVRPEEIDKLDTIAEVIERIVAARPDEVFLIEGHTDAVGSDAANLALSRARAAAVEEALIYYYAIDPANLRTVGLGEHFLRIPTPEPEEENRRVTVRRITPLLAGRG